MSAPMLPLAPARFSTTNCWPSRVVNFCASRRLTTSVAEPAGNGTISRTGRSGQRSARWRARRSAISQQGRCDTDHDRHLPRETGDELFEIVQAVVARRAGHARRQDHVVEAEQRIVVGDRLLVLHVEREAAEPAGAQRLDHRIAVDDRRVGDVDDAGAGLDPRQLGAADQVARVAARSAPAARSSRFRQAAWRAARGSPSVRAPRSPARGCAGDTARACRTPWRAAQSRARSRRGQ